MSRLVSDGYEWMKWIEVADGSSKEMTKMHAAMNTFLQMSCLESTLILEEFTSLFGKLVPGHGDSSIFLPLRVCIYASNKCSQVPTNNRCCVSSLHF